MQTKLRRAGRLAASILSISLAANTALAKDDSQDQVAQINAAFDGMVQVLDQRKCGDAFL